MAFFLGVFRNGLAYQRHHCWLNQLQNIIFVFVGSMGKIILTELNIYEFRRYNGLTVVLLS